MSGTGRRRGEPPDGRGPAMRIGLIGCGYVADFYARTLGNHPELKLVGVADQDDERSARFAATYAVRCYRDLAELLDDSGLEIIVNLTNPRSHHAVTRAALESGKHVYSEKPLAMDLSEARALVELAEGRGLYLSSAPCSLLGECAQTMWKALREGAIGRPRLVYAEMDDGMVHRDSYRTWRSETGSPWPAKDEFEVGCTLEHAGYVVTWLAAFFGPARSVASYAACLIPDKGTDTPLEPADTPDFTAACIKFASGVVARLTCSIVAPHDHALRIFGDEGVLATADTWDYGSPVTLARRTRLTPRTDKHPLAARLLGLGPRRYPLVRRPRFRYGGRGANRIDFGRGIAELAAAIREGRPCRLSARFALHVNEVVLALQDPRWLGCSRDIASTFEPIAPMPWADPAGGRQP